MNEWLVSQEFHNAGKWLVHRPGPNRPNKIARFDTKEQAELCADKVRKAIDEIIREVVSRP